MKRVGLTLRVEEVAGYGERRDCLDQRWALLLEQAGYLPVGLMNLTAGAEALPAELGLAGVILTGGNDLARLPGGSNQAPERDAFESALIEACRTHGLPVLGVCRGAQMLAAHHGAELRPVAGHVRTVTAVEPRGVLAEIYPQGLETTCYHTWAPDEASLPTELEPLARAADGTLEALRHRDCPQLGILWHPEREDPFRSRDVDLLRFVFEELSDCQDDL